MALTPYKEVCVRRLVYQERCRKAPPIHPSLFSKALTKLMGNLWLAEGLAF